MIKLTIISIFFIVCMLTSSVLYADSHIESKELALKNHYLDGHQTKIKFPTESKIVVLLNDKSVRRKLRLTVDQLSEIKAINHDIYLKKRSKLAVLPPMQRRFKQLVLDQNDKVMIKQLKLEISDAKADIQVLFDEQQRLLLNVLNKKQQKKLNRLIKKL